MEVKFISTCHALLYEQTLGSFNFRLFYLKRMRGQSDLGAAVQEGFADNHLN